MARPRKESPDLKDERDIELFDEYNRIMKSYGETARYMAKSFFYQESARKFHITAGTARNIIQKMLKMKPALEHIDASK